MIATKRYSYRSSGTHNVLRQCRKPIEIVMRPLQSAWCDRTGSALVEGAIIIPVLFTLMFGVYDFSRFFYQQHLVTTGLSDAARYLARTSHACSDELTDRAIEEANARRLATTGSIAGGAARVSGWTADMIEIRCSAVDNLLGAGGLKTYRGGNLVFVVTAATRFSAPSLGFFELLGFRAPAISAFHAERVIGPG
jgi:hypothetical protein